MTCCLSSSLWLKRLQHSSSDEAEFYRVSGLEFCDKEHKTWGELDRFSDTFGQIKDSDHRGRIMSDAFEMVVGYALNNQAAEVVTRYRAT